MSEMPNAAGSLRPLLVRFGAFGDMVILLSMIRALHQRFGVPVDVVSSGEWTRHLLQDQPGVGQLFLIRSRKMPFLLSLDQQRLSVRLRARGATPTWNCDGDARTRALLSMANIPNTHVVDAGLVGRRPDEHEVDRWLRLASLTPVAYEGLLPCANVDSHVRVPPLIVSEQWRSDAEAWLKKKRLHDKPVILIQAGNKRTTKWWRAYDRRSNTKYWPELKWSQLIHELAVIEPDAFFVLCGVSSEYVLNQRILKGVRSSRVCNVAGDLPLARLLAVQERAAGMISIDTGPAHSAAALGCPLVVLFGVADPAMYLPLSKNGAAVKHVRGFEHGTLSMRAISVEDVLAAWSGLPSKASPPEEPGLALPMDFAANAMSPSALEPV